MKFKKREKKILVKENYFIGQVCKAKKFAWIPIEIDGYVVFLQTYFENWKYISYDVLVPHAGWGTALVFSHKSAKWELESLSFQ